MLRPFLMTHRAEVRGMLLTEYNEAQAMELFREDGRREGRAEGRAEGFFNALVSLVKDGTIFGADAARRMGITEESFLKKAGLVN